MTDPGVSGSCCDAGEGLLRAGLDHSALALAAAGFSALWHGYARSPTQLLPDDPNADEAATALAARGRAELDERGRLVGIHGLTLRETRHRFVHDGRAHHTWCAFDSIGIPAALRIDAVVHTDCPTCRRPLTITATAGAPIDPGATVLWLPRAADNNLMSEFCAAADLYCSRGHLQQRIDRAHTAGDVVALADAASLGGDTWADIAGFNT